MRKFLILIPLTAALLLSFALPATDAFTGTDGTALATHNANWTVRSGFYELNGNRLLATGVVGMAQWTADAPADDQYSQITIQTVTSGAYMGVATRIHPTLQTYYFCICDSGSVNLQKYVSGSVSHIGSSPLSMTISSGAIVRLEASGTTISCKINGSTVLSATDSSITSGSVGIASYSGYYTYMDDWSGGNLSGAARRRQPVIQ